MVTAQMYFICKYVNLYDAGAMSVEKLLDKDTNLMSEGIQDPIGVCTTTLMLLRKAQSYLAYETDPLKADMCETGLDYSSRRIVAAAMLAVHKLLAPAPHSCTCNALACLIQAFTHPDEQPRWRQELSVVCRDHATLEAMLVKDFSLHQIHADSPMTRAEEELEELWLSGRLNYASAKSLRGAAFFLIGCCAVNPEEQVFETLDVDPVEMGRGIVAALLAAVGASAGMHYEPTYSPAACRAARAALRNALAPHSEWLRFKVYTKNGPAHPSRVILAPNVLKRALEVFEPPALDSPLD